jgi:lysozyme
VTAADLIRQFEGLRLTAYRCPAGLWTCGFGHTCDVTEQTTCTAEEAEKWLAEDLREAERIVSGYVTAPLTDNQRAALESFVYNVGAGAFRKSTLLRKLNAGDYPGVAAEFERWVHASGHKEPLPGLVKRRAAERELFLS